MHAIDLPFTFVLFGASGNLAKLKIYPALYTLALKKRLPKHFSIVGYARTDMSEAEFKTLVGEAIKTDMIEVNAKILAEFLSHVHYVAGQYDKREDFDALQQKLDALEKDCGGTCVRLCYLSIPPQIFTDVLTLIAEAGINKNPKNFRCIVEKPVGHDLKSFEEVKKALTTHFSDDEIYLLDHYLGKEAVRNAYYLRYANPVLERLFKNTLLHHVEIVADETLGIEERAGYFEHTGTLRDFLQSHLLLMGALVTMRLREEEESFRESRLNALQQFYLPPATSLDDILIQGQYTKGTVGNEKVRGYREEEGVAKESRVNTFVALKLLTRISRWEGVPFYLRSGKRLSKRETRISLQFQENSAVGKGSAPNRLDIILQGEAGMRLHLQTKIGGTEPAFRPLVMEDPLVCVGDCLPEHGLLLFEAIQGNKQWFLDFEEVRTAWRLIDPLQAHLDNPKTPLHFYEAGSRSPKEADEWIERDGIHWF